MKGRYGFFALMLTAGALAAGELVVKDFADPSGWMGDSVKGRAPVTDGVLKVTGPRKTFGKTVSDYPLGGAANMDRLCTGIAFKVKGDGSDEWGAISIQAGPRGGGKFCFPLKSTDVVEYRVAFSDMAPNGDNAALPAARYAAKEITGFSVGDRGNLGPGNVRRKPFGYEISDLRLIDDVQGKFVPGKFRPAPFDALLAKLKAKKPVLILSFGDSITAGTGLRNGAAERYAAVLQGLLRRKFGYDDITVRCVAIGGAHTHQSIGWLDRDLSLGKPDAATMLIGFNNRSVAQSKEAYAEQLGRWIEMFAMKTGGQATVLLIPTVQGVPRFFAQQDMADATYELGRKYGLEVAPLDKAIAQLGPVEYRRKYLPKSSIHPNAEGHRFFAEVLLRSFDK